MLNLKRNRMIINIKFVAVTCCLMVGWPMIMCIHSDRTCYSLHSEFNISTGLFSKYCKHDSLKVLPIHMYSVLAI